jgi:hypothetical protein
MNRTFYLSIGQVLERRPDFLGFKMEYPDVYWQEWAENYSDLHTSLLEQLKKIDGVKRVFFSGNLYHGYCIYGEFEKGLKTGKKMRLEIIEKILNTFQNDKVYDRDKKKDYPLCEP